MLDSVPTSATPPAPPAPDNGAAPAAYLDGGAVLASRLLEEVFGQMRQRLRAERSAAAEHLAFRRDNLGPDHQLTLDAAARHRLAVELLGILNAARYAAWGAVPWEPPGVVQ